MPTKTRLALIGAALAVASSGLTLSMAGVASASGSPSVTTSFSGSYADGETITVSGTGFPSRSANPSGMEILECSSAVTTALDASDAYCDGSTLNPLAIDTNSSGSFSGSYTVSALSTSNGSNINCDATDSCVLWVGENYQSDFSDPATTAFSHTFLMNGAAPVFTSTNSATFSQGPSHSFSVTASGPPNSVFSETGALPAGVTLSSSGVLSGSTGAAARSYPITITANDGVGTATQNFTLTVTAATTFQIVHATGGTDTPGSTYSLSLQAVGPYTAPLKWKTVGKPPKGLKLDKSTGVISGTTAITKHTKTGVFSFTVSVSDHTKHAKQTATESLSITVS